MEYSDLKRYRSLILLPIITAIVSCMHEDDMHFANDIDESSKQEIMLRAEVSQQYVTRANDNGFADGDDIGVFIVNYKGGNSQELSLTGNHADNVRFTYNEEDNKWTGAYQIFWEDIHSSVDAYSYYPFDGNLSSVSEYPFSVQHIQDMAVGYKGITGYEASDFLWAKAQNVSASSGAIILNHRHVMAGIQVALVEGSGFEDGEWEILPKQVMIESTKIPAYFTCP